MKLDQRIKELNLFMCLIYLFPFGTEGSRCQRFLKQLFAEILEICLQEPPLLPAGTCCGIVNLFGHFDPNCMTLFML